MCLPGGVPTSSAPGSFSISMFERMCCFNASFFYNHACCASFTNISLAQYCRDTKCRSVPDFPQQRLRKGPQSLLNLVSLLVTCVMLRRSRRDVLTFQTSQYAPFNSFTSWFACLLDLSLQNILFEELQYSKPQLQANQFPFLLVSIFLMVSTDSSAALPGR